VRLGWSSFRTAGFSVQPGHYSNLTSNLQQTKNETTNVVINTIVASSWWWA